MGITFSQNTVAPLLVKENMQNILEGWVLPFVALLAAQAQHITWSVLDSFRYVQVFTTC